ncbi:MAG TPA: CBS domain-containing protein, partial [Candidatus Dormibacteraeota bacterium]|nr:CBS domain-containing protein [Candidatus Dormibacteraeota bacterium]
RVRARDITEPEATAATLMHEGPSSYRLNVRLDELLERMRDGRFEMAFVTDPDGRLKGLVTRRDIARALETHRKAS